MISELARVGLHADRMKGMLPEEYTGDKKLIAHMLMRTPGAVGCYITQMKAMEKALKEKKSVMVLEDDLIFCTDIKDRLDHFENFVNGKRTASSVLSTAKTAKRVHSLRARRTQNAVRKTHDWDVFWLGGTYHIKPVWHAKGHAKLPGCTCTINRDYEKTEDPHIVQTYGCFSTHAYIVNYRSIEKILKLLKEMMPYSVGIDYSFIMLQPDLKCYAFVPGCVKQYDNRSDIGNGITRFSGFEVLGEHWWQDRMKS